MFNLLLEFLNYLIHYCDTGLVGLSLLSDPLLKQCHLLLNCISAVLLLTVNLMVDLLPAVVQLADFAVGWVLWNEINSNRRVVGTREQFGGA